MNEKPSSISKLAVIQLTTTTIMKTNKQIINDFLLQVTDKLSPKKTLILNFTTPSILNFDISGATEIKMKMSLLKLTKSNLNSLLGTFLLSVADSVSRHRIKT